ncbi:MAG: hypothetical protein HY984_00225 [Candidatus Magasanikbacteria bacterium]|nr:hypothetical protein [Candidatus Magasanikbacteria bacterium]
MAVSYPSQHPEIAARGSLFEELKLLRTCPVCRRSYLGTEVHVLESYSGSYLLHITCRHCLAAILTLVVTASMGISSVSALTDLTVVDSIRLRHAPAVSEDDLFSYHEVLKRRQVFERLVGV